MFPTPVRKWMAALLHDERGGVSILFLFLTVGLFGFVALAIDTSTWYATRQRMQGAADAAARAAAYELQRIGASDREIRAAAERDAARLGFGTAAGATLAVVRRGDTVEIDLARPATLNFARLFLDAPPVIRARAAATAPAEAPPCLTLLDPSGAAALKLADGAKVLALTCRVQVNSSHNAALTMEGSSRIDAARICVSGGVSGRGTLVPPEAGCSRLPDPLAAWSPPPTPECEKGAQTVIGIRIFEPGVYCGLIEVRVGAVVTFLPGIYYLRNGGLKVHGLATLLGVGVAFLLSGSSTVDISNLSTVVFSAPIAGPMAGIVLAHDHEAPEGLVHRLTGSSGIYYEGAVYLPRQDIVYQGSSLSANVPPFTTYIVRRLSIEGNALLILNNLFALSEVPVMGKIGAGVVLTK
jgi:hypothetical protein